MNTSPTNRDVSCTPQASETITLVGFCVPQATYLLGDLGPKEVVQIDIPASLFGHQSRHDGLVKSRLGQFEFSAPNLPDEEIQLLVIPLPRGIAIG